MLNLQPSEALNSIIEFVLRQQGAEMADALRARMQEQDTIATGDGLNSIEDRATANVLEILGEDYLLKVDQGQEAGTVANIDSLERWVTARGLAPMESVESFAAAIQQAIYKSGTIKRFNYGGANLLQYVIDQEMPGLTAALEAQIQDALEKGIIEQINNKN